MSDNILSLTRVEKSFGPRVILDGVTFGLDAGVKIGLIGDNGTGKSTLLRIIMGDEAADGGIVALRGGLRVGYLAQVPELDPEATVRDMLEAPFAAAKAAARRYEAAAAAQDPNADALYSEVVRLGGWDTEPAVARIASITRVAGLMDRRAGTLSGGQGKRVALARLLLEEPELILLDEPTNHLDTETVEWLEGWLGKTSAAVIVVTHDRYFLERVVGQMAELRGGRLRVYQGAYAKYLEARAEEEAHQGRTAKRRLKMLQSELAWARRSPKARTSKSKARLGRADALADEVDALQPASERTEFTFDGAPRLGKTILELAHVSKGYDADPVVDRLSFIMRKGERYGILGPNGSGKTTLLRLIDGTIQPDSGTLKRGSATVVATFDQHRSVLDPQATVKRTLCPDGGDTVFLRGQAVHVASWMARFGFQREQLGMAVGKLSGGEQNRVALARFLLLDANLLLLDEPTNDLDLMTIHLLEEALVGFPGCVMVVSHDRYFLDKVATTILAFEPSSEGGFEVLQSAGDYTTYRRLAAARKADAKQAHAAAAPARKAAAQAAAAPKGAAVRGPRRLTYREQREYDGLEPQIEAAELRIEELDAALHEPSLWTEGPTRGAALQEERNTLSTTLEALYARWEELASRVDGG